MPQVAALVSGVTAPPPVRLLSVDCRNDRAARRAGFRTDAKPSHKAIEPSAKLPENEKHRAVTDLLGHPSADRGTERGADTLRSHDRALADIDAAGAVENALATRPDTATLCNPAAMPSSTRTGQTLHMRWPASPWAG